MEIVNNKTVLTNISKVPFGAVFSTGSSIYMRTREDRDGNARCVDLYDGTMVGVLPGTEVEVVKSKIIIE